MPDNISLVDVHVAVNKLSSLVETHIEIEEVHRASDAEKQEIKNQLILNKLEEGKNHTDNAVEHFDARLALCKEEVTKMVKVNCYTQKETEDKITEAINVRLKNFMVKLSLIAVLSIGGGIATIWIFVEKYWHVITALAKGKIN